ncbi:MAG: SMI1/KNR4 family protein [Gemmataceae bacterium]
MVETLVVRLDRWLASNRPDYYAHLLPGTTDAQLDAFEARFSLTLPDTFRLLYRWRNGHNQLRSESLVHNLMFSSLEDIDQAKELMDGMIGTDFENPRWWRRSWVPFLENGAGDHLCVDLTAEDGGTPGQVLMFYHDWEKRPIRSPSLETWLSELVASMEDGSLELA